ncbi:hypothetical protein B0H17DRAFT_976205 [Mycena rosella]|uniref:F-box domain-containing protein n=1 Tax=Mycena rosella TaxID=1033263 RepID=A0AAD7DXS6_MYCRO|nr:hypothetical protein B0H17DRAFT_976205 [Mycena rosella]
MAEPDTLAVEEPFRLLDVPPELLIHILSFLPTESLSACRNSSRFLNECINDSVELQYLIARTAAGVTDHPSAPHPITDRLTMLHARENAFKQATPSWVRSIAVPFPTSGLYEVSAGFFFLGEEDRQALRYVELPSEPAPPGAPPLEWGRIPISDPQAKIIDFGLAIAEHDLVVVATFTPTGRITQGIPEGLITLEPFTMSSSHQPHPRARAIQVRTSTWGHPSVIVEIVGDYMVFVESYRYRILEEEPRPADHVYVYDWRTGRIVKTIEAESGTYFAAVFLSPEVLLLPNTITATMELWDLQSEQTTPALTLHLPRLVPGQTLTVITARGEPNPSVYTPRTLPRAPFASAVEDSIIIFHINFLAAQFLLFIHRRALLALLAQHAAGESCDYANWGPDMCRWLDAAGMNMAWITTTAGQRCVLLLARQTSPFFVLDFNPHNVRIDRQHCIPPEADQFADHGIWAEAVGSRLACHLTRSPNQFELYRGVSLDDERVIAFRRNPLRHISVVDVFYYGIA